MLERKSLKAQFVLSFVLIIVFSLLATIMTYIAGIILYNKLEYKSVYPANYFENQIPVLESYLRQEGVGLLDDSREEYLNEKIPAEGILYQVVDGKGEIIYGTEQTRLFEGQEDLWPNLNTTINKEGKYVRVIPIFDSQGVLRGAIALAYKITPYYQSTAGKIALPLLFVAAILSPFIYIIAFTLLFARKFANGLGKPINMLIEAAQKIKAKDLDFHLDYAGDNELGRLCSAFNDMKNELQNSLIAQWKAEQERQEMVQALAHDLKTPLAVIQGYAEALLDGNPPEPDKSRRYIQIIKDNARKGAQLTKEMLYAAELETSDSRLNIEAVDLQAFLQERKTSYEGLAKSKGIAIQIKLAHKQQANGSRLDNPAEKGKADAGQSDAGQSDAGQSDAGQSDAGQSVQSQARIDMNQAEMRCHIDAGKLERILDNIVSNSIAHTPEQGSITISAEIDRDNIRFTVCDTGMGFSPKDLKHLFSKFYRGDEARSVQDGHAGLGLYIAKKLVEMHGGRISAYNAQDGGACIQFNLIPCSPTTKG